jgi:hypothetical protein
MFWLDELAMESACIASHCTASGRWLVGEQISSSAYLAL